MPNVHLLRSDLPSPAWLVHVDDGPIERFQCPVEALLRAKMLYERIVARGTSALLIDFDGHHETQLLPR